MTKKKPSKEAAKKTAKVAAKKSISTQPGVSKKSSTSGKYYDIHASVDTSVKKRSGGSEDGGYSAAGKNK